MLVCMNLCCVDVILMQLCKYITMRRYEYVQVCVSEQFKIRACTCVWMTMRLRVGVRFIPGACLYIKL